MNKLLGLMVVLSAFVLSFDVKAQNWSLHLNGNETYITGNPLQGQYPILWYSADENRGILVGGFGGGVSYTTAQKGIYQLKYQLNVQRSRFYDHPVIFTDQNGESLGAFIGINTNLNASLMAVPQFVFGKRAKAGLGLGARYTFGGMTNFGEISIQGESTKLKEPNRALTPLGLFVPLEFTGIFGRFSITTRLEPGLTNFSRVDYFKGDRSNFLFVEFNYRLGKSDAQ
jgi:hypothetical protein